MCYLEAPPGAMKRDSALLYCNVQEEAHCYTLQATQIVVYNRQEAEEHHKAHRTELKDLDEKIQESDAQLGTPLSPGAGVLFLPCEEITRSLGAQEP